MMRGHPDRHGRSAIVVVLVLIAIAISAGAWARFRRVPTPESTATTEPPVVEDEELQSRITLFCGACHATPSPLGFPKIAWHEEVRKGYEFYAQSGRTDLDPPPLERVVAWFRQRAPERIILSAAGRPANRPSVVFRPESTSPIADRPQRPAVAHVLWEERSLGGPAGFILCDMRSGEVQHARHNRSSFVLHPLARLKHPSHATPVDLDQDGALDLVIADLGSFLPADHAEGRVVWLRRASEQEFDPVVLAEGLGRVCDVQPADFDGDGDLDLVVAEFGWHTTGRVLLLENQTEPGGPPRFVTRTIDERPGAIHVPVADLNGDGRPDFVVLISQEHETVEAFLNNGRGGFEQETLFAAGEPAFGSSGIQLVDLDGDGDLDVLYSNGDTFDSYYLRPYHGVRWLENRGDLSWKVHHLADMPGAHRALAGDLDGDGDLDIAACALVPDKLFGSESRDDFDAVLWLEQTAPGEFARHSLRRGACHHATLALGDFDGDGDLDIAAGGFGESTSPPDLTVWWNEGPQSGSR